MTAVRDLKREICSLFEVHSDESGVQRVVTPLEYSDSGDRIVIRVRRQPDGAFRVDENGEAALYASMRGGDVDSEATNRWGEELQSPLTFTEDETIAATITDERLITTYIFRVAEAAQQLHAIATSRVERQQSDIKDRVAAVVRQVAIELNANVESDVTLPLAGAFVADHVIALKRPLIVIVATTAARLMEAELIHMQYRVQSRPGAVVAVAESQAAVTRKQFERAGYYTSKTVVFDEDAFPDLLNEYAGA
jgi:multidrug efflux pump subunit AcrA (membrane-fusion protein)